jgi:hypothetical protein
VKVRVTSCCASRFVGRGEGTEKYKCVRVSPDVCLSVRLLYAIKPTVSHAFLHLRYNVSVPFPFVTGFMCRVRHPFIVRTCNTISIPVSFSLDDSGDWSIDAVAAAFQEQVLISRRKTAFSARDFGTRRCSKFIRRIASRTCLL